MRYPSTELRPANREFRRVLEAHPLAHAILKGVAVVGVCLMIADGVLTPAQSVLGAIQGKIPYNMYPPPMARLTPNSQG